MNADKWTDKELYRLEQRIKKEYATATHDLEEKYDKFMNGWDELVTDKDGLQKLVHHDGIYERYAKEHDAYMNGQYHDETGKYTDEQMFNRWWTSQQGRAKDIDDLSKQMTDRLADSSQIAQGYINNELPKVWAMNNNGVADIAQESAMEQGVTGIRFDLVDENTVARLMMGSREVRPYKPIQIDLPKINHYNYTKLQNELLQGILQGESVQEIAQRFAKVSNMSKNASIRNARTAFTGAQNAGKISRYEDLEKQGCKVIKIWVATSDDRTREEHSEADGQEQPYDEPFDVGGEELMYPADPSGSDWNIYNCRCTMDTKIDFESILDNSEGFTVIDELEEKSTKKEEKELKQVNNMRQARKALVDDVGFNKVGRLGALDDNLVISATNQLIALEERFGVVHESINCDIIAKNNGRACAYVESSVSNPLNQTLSLCPRYFSSESDHLQMVERSIDKGWSMPIDKANMGVYDVTHEYGHMVENKVVSDMYKSGYGSDLVGYMGRQDYSASVRRARDEIKDEIITIAKSNNPDFVLLDNLSEYGRSNSAEFFAEAFANSQLGKPNELGDAMNEWLVRKGF